MGVPESRRRFAQGGQIDLNACKQLGKLDLLATYFASDSRAMLDG
jgi:hypothetical protein